METNLYDLPKDMLIKLITTISDPKNLNDDDLMKTSKASVAEINARKTIKIKEYMLSKVTDETLMPIIKNIKYLKTSTPGTVARLIIQFEDLIQIRIVPFGTRFLYAIYEDTLVQYESSPIPTWHRNQEKYEKYTVFTNTIIPNLEKIYRYLNYMVNPKDFATHLI